MDVHRYGDRCRKRDVGHHTKRRATDKGRTSDRYEHAIAGQYREQSDRP